MIPVSTMKTPLLTALLALATMILLAAEPVVSTITITVPLTQEQVDALDAYTAKWNNGTGTSTIADRIRDDAVAPFLKARTEEAYTAAVARLGEAARSLSYAERMALISQVQQQIGGN
jgi:hypothetical protein